MPSTSKTLLIDGDIYLYRATSAAEDETDWGDDIWSLTTNLSEAKDIFKSTIEGFMETLEARDQVVCLSDKNNFRKDIDPTYKGHRKKTRKPLGYVAMLDWVRENYPTFSKPTLEADDCLGIMATMPRVGECVVVSDDKDLKTIPCTLYRPTSEELETISEEAADRYFLTQVLTGDTADGYSGCPTIGPKRAETVLGARASWASVVQAFEKQGLSEADALQQARLARILRWSDWDQEKQAPKLWRPS